MDQFEQAVLGYLCGPPHRFVNPQFTFPIGNACWSCPDFVVLDFRDRTVYVVEVTAAAASRALLLRVEERESRWLVPLREHLRQLDPTFATWGEHVTLFVRDEEVGAARRAIRDRALTDVSVISLDTVMFAWRWKWEGAIPVNPLREASEAG